MVHVDECSMDVMNALCDALLHWKEHTVVVQWLHFFGKPKHLPQFVRDARQLCDLLKAAGEIVLSLPAEKTHGIRHCCVGIGCVVRACPTLASEVATVLLQPQ